MPDDRSKLDTAVQIIGLINALMPIAAEVILLIRQKNGGIVIMPLLDEADSQFAANLQQIAQWKQAKGV